MKIIITNRVRNLIILVLGLIFAFFYVYSLFITKAVINKPFAGFLLLKNNLVPIVFLPEWEGMQRGVKFGDIVTAVNGQPVKRASEVRSIVESFEPGTPITYSMSRRGRRLEFTIPVTVFTLKDFLILHLIWMISGLIYYTLGLAVFFIRPNLRVSRAFLFLGIVSGFSMASNPGFCIDNSNDLSMLLLGLLGPSVLVLSLYFPVEIKARKYFYAFILLTAGPIIALYFYFFYNIPVFRVIDAIFISYLVITWTIGVAIMIRSFVTSTDDIVRLKGRMVVFGFTVAGIFSGLGLVGSLVLKVINFFWLFIPFAVVPLCVGYAIVKHNLFDVDVFIRRSASYVAVSIIVLVLSVALVSGLSFLLQAVTGQSSEIATVITIFIILVVFRPIRDKIDTGIQRRFFREKYEYSQTIRKAARIFNSIIELEELLNQILDTVVDSIKIERGCLLLREKEDGIFTVTVARDFSAGFGAETMHDYGNLVTLSSKHPLMRHLEEQAKAIQINDIEQRGIYRNDREEMLEGMEYLQAVLVVPIIFEYRLMGVMALGPKMTGAWYSSEDIDILSTLMIQTAVSIENAKKVEELKRMVEIETSYRDLQKLDEMKDDFLNMISHDLRTPMTGIKAYASLMSEGVGKMEEKDQIKYLEVILKQSDRLTMLINDLLDVQRFEAGKMEMQFEPLDIRDVVEDSFEAFSAAAMAKRIDFQKKILNERIMINGNRERLLQVMSNLLSNAIKFTPDEGKITVCTDVISDNDKRAARVVVEDNGPGIAPEYMERIFDKFQQGQKSAGGETRGSGLGLALVRQIVEHHDGSVGIKSERKQGSEFYFLLPLLDV